MYLDVKQEIQKITTELLQLKNEVIGKEAILNYLKQKNTDFSLDENPFDIIPKTSSKKIALVDYVQNYIFSLKGKDFDFYDVYDALGNNDKTRKKRIRDIICELKRLKKIKISSKKSGKILTRYVSIDKNNYASHCIGHEQKHAFGG